MTHEPDQKKGAAEEPEAPGEAAQEQSDKEERQRKERVLHTRIPAVLEQELKRAAETLRVPVSNLVRTILEDALATASAVGKAAEEELRGAAQRLAKERGRWDKGAAEAGAAVGKATAEASSDESQSEEVEAPDEAKAAPAAAEGEPGDPLDGVIGFQPLVLAVETRCRKCDRELPVGGEAFLGVRDGSGPRVIVGPECVPGKKSV